MKTAMSLLQMLQSRFVQASSQGSRRYLWSFFVLANILLMIDELSLFGQNLFLVFFLIRLSQILVAFFAATSLFLKRDISSDFLSLYILFLIAVGAGLSLFAPSEIVLRLSVNAFFYLLLAASFKGTLKDWMQIYLPVASFLLFAPIGLKASHLFHLENLYFVIASFVCSNGIVFVRKYVTLNIPDEVTNKTQEEAISFEEIVSELQFREKEEIQVMHEVSSTELIRCNDLLRLVNELVIQKQIQFKALKKTQVSTLVPRSGPAACGVKTDESELKSVLSQLIDESVASLGMQTGFVRLNIQFTLRQMLLIIEDNGRGLGKDALMRLRARSPESQVAQPAPLEVRSLLKSWGADFESATRLGVGRRVCLSFPLAPLAIEEMIKPYEGFHSYNSNEASLTH